MRLTQVLEYSNLLFSGLFVVEMAMKIIAEGPFGYIRCIYNVFDGFIVVLRCVLHDVRNLFCRRRRQCVTSRSCTYDFRQILTRTCYKLQL